MRRGTGAPSLPPVLRRFRPPVAVRVTVEQRPPGRRLAIDRRGMPGGAVDRSAGPWRTSGAWWDPRTGTLGPRRMGRRAAMTARSAACSSERGTGTWFMDGVLD